MAELVDALDLGSSTARCVGSSPIPRTKSETPRDRIMLVVERLFCHVVFLFVLLKVLKMVYSRVQLSHTIRLIN